MRIITIFFLLNLNIAFADSVLLSENANCIKTTEEKIGDSETRSSSSSFSLRLSIKKWWSGIYSISTDKLLTTFPIDEFNMVRSQMRDSINGSRVIMNQNDDSPLPSYSQYSENRVRQIYRRSIEAEIFDNKTIITIDTYRRESTGRILLQHKKFDCTLDRSLYIPSIYQGINSL